MEMEKYEVRVILKTLLETAIKLRQQQKKCDVEGKGAVNERTVQQWFKWFVSGNVSLEDEQHPR
jgi:hypothetical protein